MTFIPAKVVIANLREKIEKLTDRVEASLKRIAKYEKLVTIPDPADIDLIEDLKKILEVEAECQTE